MLSACGRKEKVGMEFRQGRLFTAPTESKVVVKKAPFRQKHDWFYSPKVGESLLVVPVARPEMPPPLSWVHIWELFDQKNRLSLARTPRRRRTYSSNRDDEERRKDNCPHPHVQQEEGELGRNNHGGIKKIQQACSQRSDALYGHKRSSTDFPTRRADKNRSIKNSSPQASFAHCFFPPPLDAISGAVPCWPFGIDTG